MRPIRIAVQLAAIAAFGAGMLAAASRLEVARNRPFDVDYIAKAGPLRWASLGHPTLAGNLYWLFTVQYIGDPRADERGWDKLFPLADLVTDLDPGHDYAYQVTGTILGSVGRVAESNAILDKGMRQVPSYWYDYLLRAFNAFYYDGDYALAGRIMERAAQIPNAPAHMREYALAMLVKGKEADAAVQFLMLALKQARDDDSRKAIQKQLDQAIVERDAAMLEDAMSRYERERGAPVKQLEELVASGLVPALPPDPFGGKYVIGADGRVHSSVHPFRYAPAQKRGEQPNPTP